MDDNSVMGATRNVGGKVQDAVGGVTGDAGTQLRGKANQAAGQLQNAMGNMPDSARGFVQQASQFIKNRPITAVLATATFAWLISGRRR